MLNIFRAWLNSCRVSRPIHRLRSRRRSALSFVADIQVLEPRALLSASFPQFVDPNPSAGDGFGAVIQPLKNGNVVIVAPGDDTGGTNAGALYLFNGSTGALISTLHGSHAGDFNYCNISDVGNNNFVVVEQAWNNGIGAVTWGSGTMGINGTISASNSLVGSSTSDYIGAGGVTVLPNGNYLIDSCYWANGTATNAGAVTWGSGATGVSGTIGASNSLIGTSTGDFVGIGGITVLPNGNYLVESPNWANGKATSAGAVTFGNGTTGVHGDVSAFNSLVGSSTNDHLGGYGYILVGFQPDNSIASPATGLINSNIVIRPRFYASITVLKNGNYTVNSGDWNQQTGAVTFGNGATGVAGVVSASNSLIGGAKGDKIGSSGVTAMANGNYVVDSPLWANGSATEAGAVTWGSGTTGIRGKVSPSNSLVGSTKGDSVGYDGIVELKNGNYVIVSSDWNNGSALGAGAVTFSNGRRGITGVVSSANSLVGSTTNDHVGGLIPNPWFLPPLLTANAQTTSSAANGVTYVGGSGIALLGDGNYLVVSQGWNNGAATDAGAVTFGSGVIGTSGVVSAANSLVGTTKGDEVGSGGIVGVGNGNFVVISPNWSNESMSDAGAVTFVRSERGFKGVVSSGNSLVGSSKGDFVGSSGVVLLNNGNYLVRSPSWGAGAFETGTVYPWTSQGLGAVTWGSGTTGVLGVLSASNSLVGSSKGDWVGISFPTILSNGNYVVGTSSWHAYTGASTWGDGSKGVSGVISATNSLVGSLPGDTIGGFYGGITLSHGNYLLLSPNWNNGEGAATWVNGNTGIVGTISATNSLVGSTKGDGVGSRYTLLTNGNYVIDSPDWNGGKGAVTWSSGLNGIVGVVSAANSLVGGTAGDNVGDTGVYALPNGNYVVNSRDWSNNLGAVTFGNGTSGVHGLVNATNSLVGSTANDSVGINGIIVFSNSNYLVISHNWNQVSGNPSGSSLVIPNAGAVTFGNGTTGVSGLITNTNSFMGTGLLTNPYYPQLKFDNAAQTFAVSFGEQGPVFVGSQITGIPAPKLTLFAVDPSPLKYPVNNGATPIAPAIEIVYNTYNLQSATIKITGNYQNGQDLLAFTNTSKIKGSWNAATGTLTLTGEGSAADYAAALASVTYRNLSKSPNRSTRTVSFSTTDGQFVSNAVTRAISFN